MPRLDSLSALSAVESEHAARHDALLVAQLAAADLELDGLSVGDC